MPFCEPEINLALYGGQMRVNCIDFRLIRGVWIWPELTLGDRAPTSKIRIKYFAINIDDFVRERIKANDL